jgi:hypothetical protein
MKKVFMMLACLMLFAVGVQAAEVTLTWKNPDFVICGSDPALSGINIYKSTDEGETKTLVGKVSGITATTYAYTDTDTGRFCWIATAFNQFGESEYSEPTCAYIGTIPDAPTGLDAVIKVLQEISQTLQEIAGKM